MFGHRKQQTPPFISHPVFTQDPVLQALFSDNPFVFYGKGELYVDPNFVEEILCDTRMTGRVKDWLRHAEFWITQEAD